MHFTGLVIMRVALGMIMTARRVFTRGQQHEQSHHRQTKTAIKRQGAEIGSEVLADATTGVKIQHHRRPDENDQRKQNALEFQFHGNGDWLLRYHWKYTAAAPITTNSPRAMPMMNFRRKTV